ncbi:MAG TPA: phosphatase PAP2 family protein, partial [Terriglobales bacterium]|nr:phosphatase PAP2 family protein [Terriglobales bacterium]
VLYLAHQRRFADSYWSVVLPAIFIAYGATPLFPAQPPRKLAQNLLRSAPGLPPLRRLNLWVLDHAGIKVNTFPSAHVAGAVSAGLALTRLLPIAGICYMVVAIGIALATVRGRYHYCTDAVLGIAVAVVVFSSYLIF